MKQITINYLSVNVAGRGQIDLIYEKNGLKYVYVLQNIAHCLIKLTGRT